MIPSSLALSGDDAAVVDDVVRELVEKTSVDADDILLVGAMCRDALHRQLGFAFQGRRTHDLDLGIAVKNWQPVALVRESFPKAGDTGIRYRIADVPVDVMPFGGIENPAGYSTPAPRDEAMVVFAFADAHARASELRLPSGRSIRIPTPANYAGLKLRAWIERRDGRDASDLALVAYWYQELPSTSTRLYESPAGHRAMERWDLDLDLAATELLALDVLNNLSDANRRDLSERCRTADKRLLAAEFELPPQANRPRSRERKLQIVAALVDSITQLPT